ncbi:centrosomal protein [Sesbania bispinosa]|nr:centrosomal protein [Sesbania bispinosa]
MVSPASTNPNPPPTNKTLTLGGVSQTSGSAIPKDTQKGTASAEKVVTLANSSLAPRSSKSSGLEKKKCNGTDSPRKYPSSDTVKRLHQGVSEGQGDSRAPVDLSEESQVVPLVWSDEFTFSKVEVRGVVNSLVYCPHDGPFFKSQSIRDLTHFTSHQALRITSAARHIEEAFLSSFELLERERRAAREENKAFSEQVQTLNEKLAKTTEDLEATAEALKNEKRFKALSDKEKDTLQKNVDVLKEQVKNVEDSYLEAKAETDKGMLDLEKAMAELEATKSKLKEAESGLVTWETKYEDHVTKLGPKAYYNTVEQLKVLNPSLIVMGSDPYAYVINDIIMEDSPNEPILFVPREEDVWTPILLLLKEF